MPFHHTTARLTHRTWVAAVTAAAATVAFVSAGAATGNSGHAATHPATSSAQVRPAGAPAPKLASRTSAQPPIQQGQQPQAVHAASAIGGRAVAATPTPDGRGFWVAWSNGAVSTGGDAHWYGDLGGVALNKAPVGIASSPDGKGYWILGGDGGVFSFGDAHFYGSTGNMSLNAPALQMIAASNGQGYDFVAGDGGIFTFGSAHFYGSTGNVRLNRPVVGMSSTPGGGGYWLVASDGGIFPFGNAGYHGSTGNVHLNAPVVGMAPTANGGGYWLVASDGGIFPFGNATFHGSGVGRTGGSSAVGVVATRDGGGYWIVLADGQVLANGDAAPVSVPTLAAAPPPASNSYTFEVLGSSGVPARWNPCDGVTYAVAAAGAPAGWQGDVSNAIGQVQAATGLRFINDGVYASTAQVPSSAKLVISWVPLLTGGDLVGMTTYWYYNTAGYTPQIASAQVQIISALPAGGGLGELPVLLHELGHAVGLAHTLAAVVMNPIDLLLSSYQPGDISGLWRLGASQGCSGFFN